MKPLFVTFEGCEGAGKSTLSKRVYSALTKKNLPVVLTREPGGTPIGEKIRDILLHEKIDLALECELFLFLAARAQHLEEIVIKNKNEGKIVLCDRFSDSTIAYQGAGRGLGVEYVTECNRQATHGFEPDITFYVDMEPKAGLTRVQGRNNAGGFDRFESEKQSFHERIRNAFLTLAKKNPQRFVVLDGTLSPEALETLAVQEIERRIF